MIITKNNKLIVGLLLGIIIMLLVFITLFATNTISFTSNNTKTTNTEEKNDEQSITNEDNSKSNEEKYIKIIEEYKNAMNDNNFDQIEAEKKYPNINTTMMHYYHTDKSTKFNYVYYDINNDKNNELIVGNEKSIYEIYTYDGTNTKRFIDSGCLGDRCHAKIYDNGVIMFWGAGGASIHGLDFFKIASDGYSKETFKSYSVEYDENNNVTITDNTTKSKTNYTTDEEVISSVIGNAKEVDLTKLTWNEIK